MNEILNHDFPTNLERFKEGALLLVDKPLEWTSFDVVNKIRGTLKAKLKVRKLKVGHAGTLDPLATGLLLICTGNWTKKIDSLQGLPKQYTGTLKLGATTPSYDAESEEDQQFSIEHINDVMVRASASKFLGHIEQVPPMYSALKKDGIPLYKLAREGQTIERKSRKIEITRFEISNLELPIVTFLVECSKGTYIRSLAYDLGRSLDSGAYLTGLRRTKIGEYEVNTALGIEALILKIEKLD